MIVEVRRTVEVQESYRVARALGLFNIVPDQAEVFMLIADVPVERDDWRIGVVYGPSGSGKSSIAAALHDTGEWTEWGVDDTWPRDRAIIDAIAPDAPFDDVTAALASVGLGTVPTWLRPFHVLSNGEKFRAELARLLASPDVNRVYVDEFTSVVDRRVACIGAQAFAKSVRRGPHRQVILLTPHEDVLGWMRPDWIVRTSLTGATQVATDLSLLHPEVDRSDYGDSIAEVVT